MREDRVNPALLQLAERAVIEKAGFVPAAPPGAGAAGMPPDPAMAAAGGMPPMDPSMAGGMPPMDPAAMGGMVGGDPAAAAGADPAAGMAAGGGGGALTEESVRAIIKEELAAAGAAGGAGGEAGADSAAGSKPKGSGKVDPEVLRQQNDQIVKLLTNLHNASGIPLPPDILDGPPAEEAEQSETPAAGGGESAEAAAPPAEEPAGLTLPSVANAAPLEPMAPLDPVKVAAEKEPYVGTPTNQIKPQDVFDQAAAAEMLLWKQHSR